MENSPFKTGKLKRSWKIQKVKNKSGTISIAVRNTAPYAHLVEDGHIKKNRNKKITGFKAGEHMLKNAIREVESNIDNYFDKEFF